MKFIAGATLTTEMKRLVQNERKIDAAIAYWGGDSLELLGLNPHRKGIRIICCLNGGKSDPKVIAKFGVRARQNDRFHAKVLLSPNAAIVGSANASSNGLPEEESIATGLVEAGLYTEDAKIIKQISLWFDREFKDARRITTKDLTDAQKARDERMWGTSNGKPRKRSLIEAIRTGKKEFLHQDIFFMLFNSRISPPDFKAAQSWAKTNQKKIQNDLTMPYLKSAWLDFYQGWPRLPKEAYLIDVFHKGNKTSVSGPSKTFFKHVAKNDMQFVLKESKVKFGYRITRDDKRIIKRAAKQLWTAAHKSNRRGVLSLSIAAPILLKFADR